MQNRTIIYLLLTLVFSLTAAPTHAQSLLPGSESGQIQIVVSPENPRPNSTIQLEAKSFNINLNALDITWYVNNKIVSSGYGLRLTTTPIGNIGSETKISVIGKISGNTVASGTTIIRPSAAYIMIEADSTAPFWYEGRKLASPRGSVRVTAFPVLQGIYAAVRPERLHYSWQINDQPSIAHSGIGEQTFSLRLPKSPTVYTRVRVTISDPRGTYSATAYVDVLPVTPTITLFSDQPHSRGRSALRKMLTLLPKESLGMLAELFYSDATTKPQYIWESNGQRINNSDGSPNAVRLSMPPVPASYKISVSTEQPDNFFDRAITDVTLITQ